MADESTPPPPPPAVPQAVRTAPVAIWSLVLAILSFTCGWLFTAVPAVICGHIARSKIRKSGGGLGGKGIATAGLILGYIALVLGIMGIPLLVSMIQSDRERLHRLSTERKEIVNGKIKVTVPGTWTKLPELNKQATLQVGDKSNQMYLIVITDAKADLDNFTLEKHHQLTRDRMLQKMTNASATKRDGKQHQRCFSSYHSGRWRSSSTNPGLDAQISLARIQIQCYANSPVPFIVGNRR
jgi:hypothetical protein